MKTACVLTAMLFILAASIAASITPTVNYQGRLTDASGAPLPDGEYEITFSIYNTESSSTASWTSGKQKITVSGGLFTYELGSNVPFPNKIFAYESRWLGITVGSDAEILPRTEFQSVPYAYTAAKADTALVVDNEDDFVHTAGDTINDDLVFSLDGATVDARINLMAGSAANLDLYSFGGNTVALWGAGFGSLYLKDESNTTVATLDAHSATGGELKLAESDGDNVIRLFAGTIGDESVALPDDAINSDEILDEPGIAATHNSTTNSITSTTSMVDIETVTITIPTSGYIHVSARYTVRFQSVSGSFGMYAQIDRTSGGTYTAPYHQSLYFDSLPSINTYRIPQYVDRMYYLSAGSYTFRLEAYRYGDGGGFTYIDYPWMTAVFYPTSYGSVSTVVTDAGGFDNAEPVTIEDESGNIQTAYEVDLRELEIKAKEKRIAAQKAYIEQLEAERALEQAKREAE